MKDFFSLNPFMVSHCTFLFAFSWLQSGHYTDPCAVTTQAGTQGNCHPPLLPWAFIYSSEPIFLVLLEHPSFLGGEGGGQ